MIAFPTLLAQHLKKSDLTQEQFAERVGLSQSAVSAILLGKRKPRFFRAESWCDALRLAGREREQFLDSMAVASATSRVATIILRLERKQVE